jgi:hypothetical protein
LHGICDQMCWMDQFLLEYLSTQYFDLHAIECFKHSVAQAGVEYSVEACVSIRGPSDYSDVQATLKTEGADGHVSYITLARFNFCSLFQLYLHSMQSLKASAFRT